MIGQNIVLRGLGSILLVLWGGACTAEPAGSDSATGGPSTEAGSGNPTSDSAATGDPSGCDIGFAELSSTIIVPQCAKGGCHNAMTLAGGLSLEGSQSEVEARLSGVPSPTCDGWVWVAPGDPSASLLVAKLFDPAPCGVVMPVGAPLPAEDIACIEGWVAGLGSSGCEMCGGETCIDTVTDAANCGGCDSPCPSGVACVDGACACPDGATACDGACVDTQSDPAHCSDCGEACMGNLVCLAGGCSAGCDALTNCGGACVDTQTDPAHCGDCDMPCDGGQACGGGTCGCDGDPLSYVADIEPILTSSCEGMGCHVRNLMTPMPAAGLELTTGVGYDELVGVSAFQCGDRLRVSPGQPDASYVLNKLRGVDMCSGTMMPRMGQSLPAGDLAAISAWICHGALP